MSNKLSKPALNLLELLAGGCFHSGEQLGKQLGLSRASVSQHIAKLRAVGIVIHSVTGKGYQLANNQQLLDRARLAAGLPNNKINYFTQIDSTNRYLLDRLGQLEKGELCLAEMQTAGRGRRGRVWQSPLASQIIFSLYWPLAGGMQQASGLSLVVGIALVEALKQQGILDLQLKWPNDLYYQGQKLGGILVEMNGQAQGSCHLIIGVGINVCIEKAIMTDVEQLWTDLSCVVGHSLDRTQLTSELICSLNEHLRQFEVNGMAPFCKRWLEWDLYLNKEVSLISGQKVIKGIACGIDHSGALLLQTEAGIKAYNAGELSLRAVK